MLRNLQELHVRALQGFIYPQHLAEWNDAVDRPPVRAYGRGLCISSAFPSFRIFAALELLTRGRSVRAAPGFPDFARVLEDVARTEPAKRFHRSLLSGVGSRIPQEALHVGNGQEGTAVDVEWLVIVLLEAVLQV